MNEMKIIQIPRVGRDDRIGSVFNDLFRVIGMCDGEKDITFDFNGLAFFHPFFIAPLAIYCDTANIRITHINQSDGLKSYKDAIGFDSPRIIERASDVDAIITEYRSKSYTPICKFVTHSEERDRIESRIQNLIEIQSRAKGDAKAPLSYMFSELVTNIVEHSQSEYGYVYSQYLNNEGCVDICIADKGITVFGSYINAGKFTEEIQGNPARALVLAVGGYSTKDRPDNENRGYGISTSIKMLVEGLHGAFFMLSGNAFYRHDNRGITVMKLPESIEWYGTIILLRIPIKNLPADFDFYKYVE